MENEENIDEQLLDQPEPEEATEEEGRGEKVKQKSPVLEESTKIIKKKVKKRIAVWLATSGCACCLPLIICVATIGIVTVVIFYIEGFFSSNTS